MNSCLVKHSKKRVATSIMVLLLSPFSAYAADVPVGGVLTLQDALRIAIKNAPSMMIASIQVDLAKAGETAAGDPFDTSFKTSMAYDQVRGYNYPKELQQFSAATGGSLPASTFMTDHQNNTELKSSLTKLFRNGIYTDFTIAIQSSDSAKVRSDFSPIPAGLVATGLKPGAVLSDYTPLHPSTMQLTFNFPLLKFRGSDNIASANERMLRKQREAAEMNLKQGVASIMLSVVDSYWGYKAALVKLQFTQESETQVARWLGKMEKTLESRRISSSDSSVKEIGYLKGYAIQLSGDVSKAQQVVNVARNKLAQALGVSSDEARTIVGAKDDFPVEWSNVLASFNDELLRKKWNDLAEQNRFDLKAAQLQLDAAKSIYLGAQNDEQSKLDLSLVLKHQGLSMGGGGGIDFSSVQGGGSDLASTVVLSYELKLNNNKAVAQVTKTRYLALQKEVELNNAKRSVALSVDTAVSSMHNSLIALMAARKQTEEYVLALNQLVQDDSIKLGGVFDLVSVEQARLKSVSDHVTAVQNVALAVSAAHFQTGTMIKQMDSIQEVNVANLTILP